VTRLLSYAVSRTFPGESRGRRQRNLSVPFQGSRKEGHEARHWQGRPTGRPCVFLEWAVLPRGEGRRRLASTPSRWAPPSRSRDQKDRQAGNDRVDRMPHLPISGEQSLAGESEFGPHAGLTFSGHTWKTCEPGSRPVFGAVVSDTGATRQQPLGVPSVRISDLAGLACAPYPFTAARMGPRCEQGRLLTGDEPVRLGC
jgi:hypothetical protein